MRTSRSRACSVGAPSSCERPRKKRLADVDVWFTICVASTATFVGSTGPRAVHDRASRCDSPVRARPQSAPTGFPPPLRTRPRRERRRRTRSTRAHPNGSRPQTAGSTRSARSRRRDPTRPSGGTASPAMLSVSSPASVCPGNCTWLPSPVSSSTRPELRIVDELGAGAAQRRVELVARRVLGVGRRRCSGRRARSRRCRRGIDRRPVATGRRRQRGSRR